MRIYCDKCGDLSRVGARCKDRKALRPFVVDCVVLPNKTAHSRFDGFVHRRMHTRACTRMLSACSAIHASYNTRGRIP